MQVIRESRDRIEIRIRPGLHQLLSGILFIPGALSLFAGINEALTKGWVRPLPAIAIGMGLSALTAGVAIYIKSPATVLRLHWGFGGDIVKSWPLLSSRRSLRWDEIDSAELLQDRDTDGGLVYKPVLILKSGEKMPLAHTWSHDRRGCESAANEIHAFLNPPGVASKYGKS